MENKQSKNTHKSNVNVDQLQLSASTASWLLKQLSPKTAFN